MFSTVSSITTDGASINKGDEGGLWALMRADRREDEKDLPLLTLWCAAHRADLAFEDLEGRVLEIHRSISDCAALSTFFHRSGLRTKDLEQIATGHKFQIRRLPPYFEVRFTQFSEDLLEAFLYGRGILHNESIVFRSFSHVN